MLLEIDTAIRYQPYPNQHLLGSSVPPAPPATTELELVNSLVISPGEHASYPDCRVTEVRLPLRHPLLQQSLVEDAIGLLALPDTVLVQVVVDYSGSP